MSFLLANKGLSIFIVLSVAFVLLISKDAPNPRLTYDSRAYIEASRGIDTYFNGKNSDGHSYLFRPPIIPLYLHFFRDKILAMKWLNTICFVLSLWMCYFIGNAFKLEPIFHSLFVISVGTSYPWLQNHFFVWSEPLFCAQLLLLVWVVIKKGHWVWIGTLCVFLYFVRKAGLIIAAGVVFSYLTQREIKKAFLIGLMVSLLGMSWEWLTWIYSNGSTTQAILEDLPNESRRQYLDVITAWWLPRNVSVEVRSTFLFLSIVLLLARFKPAVVELAKDQKVKMIFTIAATYILVFVMMWSLDYNEAERYLSVVIPLSMLLFISLERKIYLNLRHRKYIMLLTSALWMIYPIGRTLYHLL